MTNESISGFLNSIAEAKRAFDAEPGYQSSIHNLEREAHSLRDTIASRELRIHDLKQNEETLTAKLRSVEAERDDAGFRALVEAEKVSGLLVAVRTFVTEGLKCISAVEGIEQIIVTTDELSRRSEEVSNVRKENDNLIFTLAEKEEELQRLKNDMRLAQEQLTRPFAPSGGASYLQGEGTDHFSEILSKDYKWQDQPHSVSSAIGQGQSETPPTAFVSDPIPPASGNESEKDPTDSQTGSSKDTLGAEGQSDGPFATTPLTTPLQDVRSDTAEPSTDAALPASPPERNRDRATFFTNRKYFDITYFVPLHQWLNEGGSREDYYWRPAEANVPLPEASKASHNS